MFKRYLYRNYRSFSGVKYIFTRRITFTGWLVLAGGVCMASVGADTNQSLGCQTFALLGAIIFISLVTLPWQRPRISIDRVLPRFGSAGETFSYQMILRNNSRRAQRGLKFTEECPDPRPTLEEFSTRREPGEEKRNWFDRTFGYYRWTWLLAQNTRAHLEEKTAPDLAAGSEHTLRASLTPLRRGVLRLTGTTIACPDPLGLFQSLRKIPHPQNILILPKRYHIPPFELPGTMKYQQGGVSMASSVGESEEFASLREYRPGDPMRRMHWKSFAKAGRPIVKEFQEEFFVRHALVLDTFSVPAQADIFEEAVSVAASLAYTIQRQDSLLDLMFVGPEAYCFTSGRGLSHTEQMLEILASVQPCREKEFLALEHLVLGHANDLSGCICVFVEWTESRQKFVKMLRARGVPLIVFVVTDNGQSLSPGVMADQPDHFHQLTVGKIGETLAAL